MTPGVFSHRWAALQVLVKLELTGGDIEQAAAVQLSLQVNLGLVVQHLPRGVQEGLLQGELLSHTERSQGPRVKSKCSPAVHGSSPSRNRKCQTGTGRR